MKKCIILLTITATSFALHAQNKSDKEPYLTKSFATENINSVVSETSGGNLSVTAVNPSEVRVEVFVRQNGNKGNTLSPDELKERIAEDYDLTVSVNNGALTASAKSKHNITNWKKSLSFSFKIYVPEKVTTELKTSGGNIELTGISGNQEFKTSGGNLSLNSLSGNINGKTSGGNITLKNCKNDLDLSTSGGNIEAENSEGHIHVATSGGNVKLNNLNGEIKATTSGGNIDGDMIEGELSASTSGGNVSLQKLGCSVKASTSGGNIDVSVVHPGKYITLNNSGGKVRLTLPKNTGMDLNLNASKINAQNVGNFNGTKTKTEMDGAVNGGGLPVTIDAGGGKIDLILE